MTWREDEELKRLVDRCYKLSRVMRRTHLKDDILAFIKCAQEIEARGYHVMWVKHHGCIGATRVMRKEVASAQ
jgi:hypothetical protein